MGEGQSKLGEGEHVGAGDSTPPMLRTAARQDARRKASAEKTSKRKKAKLLLPKKPHGDESLPSSPGRGLRHAKKKLKRQRGDKARKSCSEDASASKACIEMRDVKGNITAEISSPLSANVKRRGLILQLAQRVIENGGADLPPSAPASPTSVDAARPPLLKLGTVSPEEEGEGEECLTERMFATEKALSDVLAELSQPQLEIPTTETTLTTAEEGEDATPATKETPGDSSHALLSKPSNTLRTPLKDTKAGSGYLVQGNPALESSDDEDASSDDVDWSALDDSSESETDDSYDEDPSDSSAEITTRVVPKDAKSGKPRDMKSLLLSLTQMNPEDIFEIGAAMYEQNPKVADELAEAMEDHIALKQAMAEDESSDDDEESESEEEEEEEEEPVVRLRERPTLTSLGRQRSASAQEGGSSNRPRAAYIRHSLRRSGLSKSVTQSLHDSMLGISQGFLSNSHTCEWNDRFQLCIEGLKNYGQIQQQRNKIYQELSNLAQDFIHCAKTYGRIIISEVETPLKMKTIAPISDIGGFAGGDKYIVNNILFKFATDSNGLFDTEEAAIKVAGHDLKGLIAYFNLGIADLHFPLMALVDYLGYRLIAMSVLPISKKTIVYGSSDGANTIHNSDPEFSSKMQLSAKLLNLKAHKVGLTKKSSKELYSAGDLEGHHVDGKFYLLDFSRSFPPCSYDTSLRNSYLFRLLRPEFVKNYSKPLCPDAFSGFVEKHSPQEHIDEVEEATRHLIDKVIPAFARTLPTKCGSMRQLRKELRVVLHEAGINLRYLGIVRRHVSSPSVKQLILVEMIARVIKHEIRYRMRKQMKEFKLPLEHACREMLTAYMNLVFGTSEESTEHFDLVLKPKLCANFVDPLSQEELEKPLKSMLTLEHLCDLFQQVSKMVNLEWTPSSTIEFSNHPDVYTLSKPFDTTDFLETGVSVRHLNIVALAQGYVLKSKARELGKGIHSGRLCKIALEKFQEALAHNPGDKRALRELADVYHLVGDMINANSYYKRAIDADPSDANTLFKYAVFLEESMDKLNEAEEYYLRTLEADVRHDHCMQRYGHFLEAQGHPDDAENFFIRASQIRACRGMNANSAAIEQGAPAFIF